jgi:hypothetical protein
MSLYDYDQPSPEPAAPPPRSSSRVVLNIATVIVLLAALCLCLTFLVLFFNPNAAINPFPPPTQVGRLLLPTATWTPLQMEATWTSTATPLPAATSTLAPSVTPGVIDTPITLPSSTSEFTATVTPQPSATPKPTGAPFTASVVAVDGTILDANHGCTWWGVGGTTVDLNGNPVIGLVVKLAGLLPSSQISMLTVTGTAPIYGQAGYEFKLGDAPQTTSNNLYVQLLDQAGLPLSEPIYFNTSTDCAKNLILVRFKQVK